MLGSEPREGFPVEAGGEHVATVVVERSTALGPGDELLVEASRASYPPKAEETIDEKLEEVFEGSARKCDPEDAEELASWMRQQFGVASVETVGYT